MSDVRTRKDDPRSASELMEVAKKALGKYQRDIAIDFARQAADRSEGVERANATVFAARVLGDKGMYAEGKAILDRVLADHPDHAAAHAWRGWFRFQQHDDDGALADFGRALELDPNLPDAYKHRASVSNTLGDHEQAISDFEKILDHEEWSGWALQTQALSLQAVDRVDEAKDRLRRAIAEHELPRAAEALEKLDVMPNAHAKLILGKHYRLSRNGPRAEELIHEALADGLEGKYPAMAWTELSTAKYDTGDKAGAADLLKKATELALPDDAAPYRDLGLCLYNLERDDESLAAYTKATEIDPNDAVAWKGIASVHLALSNDNEMLAACDKALAADPYYAYPRYLRGVCLTHLGRRDEAMEELALADAMGDKSARERRLKDYGGYTAGDEFGNCSDLLNHGNWYAAIDRFGDLIPRLEAEVVAPGDFAHRHLASAISNLGYAKYRAGMAAEGIVDLERAAEMRPTFADPVLNMGNALKELGRYDEAIAAHTRVIALNPRNPDGFYNRGLVHMRLGDASAGLKDFRAAIGIGYRNTGQLCDAYFNSARCLLALGEVQEAADSYQGMADQGDFLGGQFAEAAYIMADGRQKNPTPDPDAHPFRFYGIRPRDWNEGANCGHFYRIQFKEVPSDDVKKELARAFMRVGSSRVDTTCAKWRWNGKWAFFTVGETEISEFGRHFDAMEDLCFDLHSAWSLEEVVYLNAKQVSEDPWEDWSYQVKPTPDAGPDFGTRGQVWVTEISDQRIFGETSVDDAFEAHIEAARLEIHKSSAMELAKKGLAADEVVFLPIPKREVPKPPKRPHVDRLLNTSDSWSAGTDRVVINRYINHYYRAMEIVDADGNSRMVEFPTHPFDLRGGVTVRKDDQEALVVLGTDVLVVNLDTGATRPILTLTSQTESLSYVGNNHVAVVLKRDGLVLFRRDGDTLTQVATYPDINGPVVSALGGKVLLCTEFGYGPDIHVLGLYQDTLGCIAKSQVGVNGYSLTEIEGRVVGYGDAGDLEVLNLDKGWEGFAQVQREAADKKNRLREEALANHRLSVEEVPTAPPNPAMSTEFPCDLGDALGGFAWWDVGRGENAFCLKYTASCYEVRVGDKDGVHDIEPPLSGTKFPYCMHPGGKTFLVVLDEKLWEVDMPARTARSVMDMEVSSVDAGVGYTATGVFIYSPGSLTVYQWAHGSTDTPQQLWRIELDDLEDQYCLADGKLLILNKKHGQGLTFYAIDDDGPRYIGGVPRLPFYQLFENADGIWAQSAEDPGRGTLYRIDFAREAVAHGLTLPAGSLEADVPVADRIDCLLRLTPAPAPPETSGAPGGHGDLEGLDVDALYALMDKFEAEDRFDDVDRVLDRLAELDRIAEGTGASAPAINTAAVDAAAQGDTLNLDGLGVDELLALMDKMEQAGRFDDVDRILDRLDVLDPDE